MEEKFHQPQTLINFSTTTTTTSAVAEALVVNDIETGRRQKIPEACGSFITGEAESFSLVFLNWIDFTRTVGFLETEEWDNKKKSFFSSCLQLDSN